MPKKLKPSTTLTAANILALPFKPALIGDKKQTVLDLRVSDTKKVLQTIACRWAGAKNPTVRKVMDVGPDFTDEQLKAARRMALDMYDNHKLVDPSAKPTESGADEPEASSTIGDTIEAFYAHRQLVKVKRRATSTFA